MSTEYDCSDDERENSHRSKMQLMPAELGVGKMIAGLLRAMKGITQTYTVFIVGCLDIPRVSCGNTRDYFTW